MQQPLVRVVLATFWLVVSVSVAVGTTAGPSYLTPDQYSPQASQWKDPGEDQTLLYLSIDPAASIAESLQRIDHPAYIERSFIYPPSKQDGSSNNEFVSLREGKQSENSVGSKLTDGRTSQSYVKKQESFSHDVPPELQDSFVADDTFQDQGPGSVEIYKLDLYKEKSLLSPTPTTRTVIKNKSKIPKKTSDTNWKSKTSEYKTTSPKVLHRQSNFFDEPQTDSPSHSDSFGTGGVPELQVGCEGLEASSHKLKRSINSPSKGRNPQPEAKPMFDATPISLDLEYELSSEETYEEMDELHRLKKLENTTKKPEKNRGDMDARLQDTELSDDKNRPEKFPVRGDLGISTKSSGLEPPAFILNNQTSEKERSQYNGSSNSAAGNLGRKLLWAEDLTLREKFANQRRSKRSYWGFEEDEGVVSSDELQTENQRRRQYYERQQLEGARRREQTENQTQTEIHSIREEYERLLQQRRREDEERRRRLQQDNTQRVTPDRRQEHDQRQQDYRKQQEEYDRQMQQRPRPTDHRRVQERQPYYGSYDRNRSPTEVEQRPQRPHDEESRKRQQQQQEESEKRRQEYEEARRRYQEEQSRRRVSDDDTRRRDEIDRRRQETDASRPAVPNSDRYLSPEERRKLDERRREWMLKRQQHEEEERRRQQQAGNQTPSNLQYPHRSPSNGANRPESESGRRSQAQEERERERKLREYIQRNQPINVSRSSYRRREDFPQVRRLEDERRGQESRARDPYRNATSRNTETENRERAEDPRRRHSEQRGVDEENRRRVEEQRRRQQEYTRQMEEENRKRLEDQRRQEEHTRYQEYSGRPQSVSNWTQGRKVAGNSYYSRPSVDAEKHTHGPSAPVNGSPRNYMSWRLEEEQRKRDEEMKKEILRREDETRRAQSRRYEEERRRQEAIRIEAERQRKELVEQQARRSQIGRAWPSETTKPEYGDHRPQEHRRRPDATFVPANLVLDESRRAAERDRQRQEQERRRLDADRRRQDEERLRQAKEQEDYDRVMKEQQRRQEEARLHALPVSARVIIRPRISTSPATPIFRSRNGFDNDIDFSGINPHRQGVLVPKFPVPPTRSPPMKSPSPCVWAVVQCCPTNKNRLVTCFESVGCPGVNWDGNPCRGPVAQAARNEVAKFYAAAEMDDYS